MTSGLEWHFVIEFGTRIHSVVLTRSGRTVVVDRVHRRRPACGFLVRQNQKTSKGRKDDLGRVTLHALVVSPFSGFDRTLDIDFRSFCQVLLRDFGRLAENDHAMPFRALALFLRLLVGPAFRRGQRQAGHRVTGFGLADLGDRARDYR